MRSTRWDNSLVVNRQGIVKTKMLPISQPTRNRRHAIQTRYILMPVSMLVKCEKCGYENFPQHRYCGMCAAELHLPGPGGSPPRPAPVRVSVPSVPTPPVVSRPVSATPAPRREEKVEESAQLSGPSFLGLGNEPAENRSVSYLLEDDEPRHRGRNFILILLLAAAAFAAWHWRQDLRVIAGRFLSSPPPVGSTSTPDSNSTAAASTSATPQADASANNQVQQPAQAPAASPSDQTPAAPVPAGSGAADSSQSPPASQPPADQAQPSDQSQAATSTAAKPDDSADAPASQPAPERKAAKVQPNPKSRIWRLRAKNTSTEMAYAKTARGHEPVCWRLLSNRAPRRRMCSGPCMQQVTVPLATCRRLIVGFRARCARIPATLELSRI